MRSCGPGVVTVMGLTRTDGPLSPRAPRTVNYAIDGPAHKLLLHPFPRRVRAEFAGRTVLDTTRGVLLHETALDETGLPTRWYLSPDDVAVPLERSDTIMRCPYKGRSHYWNLRLSDGREIADAGWGYADPLPESARIGGRVSFLHDDLRTLVDGAEI